MAYEQKDGQGSLFKNKRKETEKHPDYTGSITINGVECWLSAWLKDAKSGEKYMSLSVGKPKEQRSAPAREAAPPADNFGNFGDSEIPF